MTMIQLPTPTGFARVIRACPNPEWCSNPHTWEFLNPETDEHYCRGRVVFFCDRYVLITTIERMRMLRG
jgi:hypothetical protein